MLSTKQKRCFKQRNPFRGRRILTDVDEDRQESHASIQNLTTESKTPRDGHKSSSRSRARSIFSSHIQVIGKNSSGFNQQLGEIGSSSQSLTILNQRRTHCCDNILNKNANNDSNGAKLDRSTTDPKAKCTSSENPHGSRSRQEVQTVDSSNNGDVSQGTEKLRCGGLTNQGIHQLAEIIPGVTCVRMCSHCVKETSGERTCIDHRGSTIDSSKAWKSTGVYSKQATDKNSNKPLIGRKPPTDAPEESADNQMKELTSAATWHQKPIGVTAIMSQAPTFANNSETISEKWLPSFIGEDKTCKCDLSHKEKAMHWRQIIVPRDIQRRFSEGKSHFPHQKSRFATETVQARNEINMQGCSLEDQNRHVWTQPKESCFSSCPDGHNLRNRRIEIVGDLPKYCDNLPESSNVNNGFGQYKTPRDANLNSIHINGSIQRLNPDSVRKAVRLIDHLEQKERSHVSERRACIQSSLCSGEQFKTRESIRSAPNQTLFHRALMRDTCAYLRTTHADCSNLTNSRNTPLRHYRHLSQSQMDNNAVSSKTTPKNNDLDEKSSNGRRITLGVENTAKERELPMPLDNCMKKATTRLWRSECRNCGQEQKENTAAKLFLMDRRRLLSPFVTCTNIENEYACRSAPLNTKYDDCYLKSDPKYEQSEGVKEISRARGIASKPRQIEMAPRSNSLEFGHELRHSNTSDVFDSSQTREGHNLVSNPRPGCGSINEEINQHSGSRYGWERPALLYPKISFQSTSNKSTQTESQELSTKTIQAAEDCQENTEVSWMQRMIQKGSSGADGRYIHNPTQSSKQDYFFKPIYPKESTPISSNEENEPEYVVDRACPVQIAQETFDAKPSKAYFPVPGSHSLPRKTSAMGCKNMTKKRKTTSSTLISAVPSSNETYQSLRPYRSMTNLEDTNQSMLFIPNDHFTGTRSNGNQDFSSGSLKRHQVEKTQQATAGPSNSNEAANSSETQLPGACHLKPNSCSGPRGNRNWSNTSQAPAVANSFIGEYLYNLWENQYLCDVAVTVGGKQMMAHKLVLAAFSDAFCPSSPYTQPSICFDIPDSTPEAVFQIFRYMYTSSMDINDDNLEAALNAALFMGVSEVIDIIKDIIKQPDTHNFQKYAKISELLQVPFDVSSSKMARENLTDLVHSEHFPKMSFDQLLKILDEPDVMVKSEEDTLLAVIKWIEGNPNELPRAHLLLEKLVLESIPARQLSTYMDQHPNVFSQIGVLSVLTKAFRHHALKQEETGLQSLRNGLSRGDVSSRSPRRDSCDEMLNCPQRGERKGPGLTRCTNNSEIDGNQSHDFESTSSFMKEYRKRDDTTYLSRSEELARSADLRTKYKTPIEDTDLKTDIASTSCQRFNSDSHETGKTALSLDRHDEELRFEQRLKGGSDYVVGRNFASKTFKDAAFRRFSKRLGSRDKGHSSTRAATFDRNAFSFRGKQRASSDEKNTRTPTLAHRMQSLKFRPGRNTPTVCQTSESAFHVRSSRNDNHTTGGVPDDRTRSRREGVSSPGKREGDGFWCRPLEYGDSTDVGTMPQRFSRRKLMQSSHNNNTTNNADGKQSHFEDTALAVHAPHWPTGKSPNGKSERCVTPFQLTKRRKQSSWKKRYLRLQNKALLRVYSNVKSPDLKMFERRRPKKRHSHNKNSMSTTCSLPFAHFDPRVSRNRNSHLDNFTDDSMLSSHQLEETMLNEMKHGYVRKERRVESTKDRNVFLDSKSRKMINKLPSTSFGGEDSRVLILLDSTRDQIMPSVQKAVDPNQSLSFLGHDERTSAFKKFTR